MTLAALCQTIDCVNDEPDPESDIITGDMELQRSSSSSLAVLHVGKMGQTPVWTVPVFNTPPTPPTHTAMALATETRQQIDVGRRTGTKTGTGTSLEEEQGRDLDMD